MPKHRLPAFALLLACLTTPPLTADERVAMLEEGALAAAYNSVLADYLLAEGATALDEPTRRRALDQLVSALEKDIEISPEELRAAALGTAGAALADLFGGEAAAVVGDPAYERWKGWVESAVTLRRAGYAEDANRFFAQCVELFPYGDLRGRCALELATAEPARALERLTALTRDDDPRTVDAALRLLGRLAAADHTPDEARAAIRARITELTTGLARASHGLAACEALVLTGDPEVVPTLRKLSTGMMNREFQPCAQRGLLLTFGDESVVPILEKRLTTGQFSTIEPIDRLRAASLLIEAGEPAGLAWAREELTRRSKKARGLGLKKLMQTEKPPDFRPQIVRVLVRTGGEASREILRSGLAATEPDSWIHTWLAIGLLELDDTSGIAAVRAALAQTDWEFTVVRVSTALARHGDTSGVSALARLYAKAAEGLTPATGKAVMAFLGGRGEQHEASREAREAELRRLKVEIATALGDIGGAESVAVLERMLADEDRSCRRAAAHALIRRDEPEALTALARALDVDYGPANPSVHARIVRRAAHAAPSSTAAEVLAAGERSRYPAVRFLALCATGAAEASG